MFLDVIRRRNPQLIRSAIELHQAGIVPPNTYVIDLDTVATNAAAIASEAAELGLDVFAMTKQVGRSAGFLDTVADAGIDRFVAVDIDCARPIHHGGHQVGHVGHLVQIAHHEAVEVAQMNPSFWTVFSPNKAREVAAAASQTGVTLPVLVRVAAPGDEFYSGHEGGVSLDDLPAMIELIDGLDGVEFAGLTTFPALLFDLSSERPRTTVNVDTLHAARAVVERVAPGRNVEINAPGTTSSVVLKMLADAGATQVEPGHGLTGSTPLHVYDDLPERPAMVYVSEVAHNFGGKAYAFGGGLYVDPVFGDYPVNVVVAHDETEASTEPLPVAIPSPAAIDYYAPIDPGTRQVGEGASVVFGFRAQAFVTRARVAAVAGISTGTPRLVSIATGFGDVPSSGDTGASGVQR